MSGLRLFPAILIGCAALAAIGFVVFVWGVSRPIYSVDYSIASQAFLAWCSESGRASPEAGDRYLALFTNHYPLKDAGVGLMLVAATTAGLAYILRSTSEPGEPWLRTPRHRLTFPGIGIGVIALAQTGTITSLMTDQYRLYYPVCADTIAIPIFASTQVALVLTPVLIAIGAGMTLAFGVLPVSLARWDVGRPVRSWVVTLAVGAVMLLIAAIAIMSVPTTTNVWLPSILIALYLLAATRAALLAPRRPKEQRAAGIRVSA